MPIRICMKSLPAVLDVAPRQTGAGGNWHHNRRSAAAASACRAVRTNCASDPITSLAKDRRAAENLPRRARHAGGVHRAREFCQEFLRGRRHRGGRRRRRQSQRLPPLTRMRAHRSPACAPRTRSTRKTAIATVEALKAAGARHIYLAGRPGEREAALRAAGVQSFIYEGCDVLATLTAAYDILGAERVNA